MEDILKKISQEEQANKFIKDLEQGKDVVFPNDPQEQNFYREKIEKFISHNEEKYRDKEGMMFFDLLKTYLKK